jgi:hypothetical protein
MNNDSPNEESFNEVFDLFETELRNLYRERSRELKQKINDESISLIQQDQSIDPIFNRYNLLREHAENIGADFLSAFESVIHRFSSTITKPLNVKIVNLFYKRYKVALSQQEQTFRRIAASLGRSNDFNSMFLPVTSIYSEFKTVYINRLEVAVKRHNLELSTKTNIQTEGERMGNFFAPSQGRASVKKVLLEECRKECQKRKLPKGQTIRREIKYQIAQAIGMDNLGTLETFKSRNSAYHLISKMLSELGYCRKAASKYNE